MSNSKPATRLCSVLKIARRVGIVLFNDHAQDYENTHTRINE